MNQTTDKQPVDRLIARLQRVRAAMRRTVLEVRVSQLLATAVPLFMLVASIDFMLRLPEVVRWIILISAAVGIVVQWRRMILPAIRFAPSLVDVALRVESRFPSLSGRLASGVDFARLPASERTPLVARSLTELDHRASNQDFRGVVESGPAHKMAAIAIVFIVLVTVLAVLRPTDASIAARRILAPWSDASWPARTGLASATPDDLVHPRGEPLTLAVDLTKGDPETDRVTVRLRTIRDGETAEWRDLVLTRQQGSRFERVVDTDADGIEYEFLTTDSATDRSLVRIVPAPSVLESRVRISPPTYAERLGTIEAELGPGTDRRSRLPRAVLEGSTAGLELELSRPIPIPRDSEGVVDPDFIAETVMLDSGPVTLEVDPLEPTRWRIGWSLGEAGELEIRLRDENDLRNLDPIRYRIDTVADRRPSTTIVDPGADRTVTVRAMVPLQADARDDVGLSEFAIIASLSRDDTSSRVERIVELETVQSEDDDPVADASISSELDVASFDPIVGDTIEVIAIARDEWVGPDGPRDEVRSEVRKLRVVSEIDLMEQLQAALGSVRRSAIRMEGDQAALADRVRETGGDRGVTREQDRIGDRIESVRDAIDAIRDRRDENQIEDELLADVIEQASEILDAADLAADQALADLDRASQERTTAADPSTAEAARESAEEAAEEAERQAVEAQQEVRDELTDLAATLDRGEDAWVVSRRIERLAEDLEAIRERTADLSERTMGRDRDELSPEERRELDDVAREQGDLSDRAEDLLEELEDRADAMEMADPTEAEGLRKAAEQARQEGLEEQMREAEERARENQLQQAAQAQQQAAEALERMQETIEESRKAMVEELRRRMESLVESLEALLKSSEDEVIAVSRLIAGEALDAADLSRAMIALHRNTMAVAGEAMVADERIGRVVSRAADNQSAAIRDLRAQPPALEEARASEERGVSALREALELAEQAAEQLAEEQAEEERQRLLASYREVLDLQTGVRVETGQLAAAVDGPLNRRQLIKSRRLAKGEAEVGVAVASISEEFTEVSDSLVFSMTHRNLDAWISDASDRLRDGKVDGGVVSRQVMVMDALVGLIDALEQEGPPEDDPFGQQQAGGGGQAGGGQNGPQGGPQPLIPPIAELKMLRSLQIQILDATRRIDQDPGDATDRDERLADIARIQSDLHGVANALVNSLEMTPAEEQSGEGRGSKSGSDADEPMNESGDES